MCRGWVGPVRGIRDEHRAALRRSFLAVASIDKRTDDHDAGHLAVRACRRLQGNAGQPGDLSEMLLEFVDDLQSSLRFSFGSEWMQIGKICDARDLLIQ